MYYQFAFTQKFLATMLALVTLTFINGHHECVTKRELSSTKVKWIRIIFGIQRHSWNDAFCHLMSSRNHDCSDQTLCHGSNEKSGSVAETLFWVKIS